MVSRMFTVVMAIAPLGVLTNDFGCSIFAPSPAPSADVRSQKDYALSMHTVDNNCFHCQKVQQNDNLLLMGADRNTLLPYAIEWPCIELSKRATATGDQCCHPMFLERDLTFYSYYCYEKRVELHDKICVSYLII